MTIAEGSARLKPDGRTAVADDKRRNGHLKTVEQVCFEKSRDSHAAALHKDSAASPVAEGAEQLR